MTGKPIPAEVKPRRPGDPARLVASSEEAKRILGWTPKRADLQVILKDAWDWHQQRYQ